MTKAFLSTPEIEISRLKDFNYKVKFIEPDLDIQDKFKKLKVAYIDENSYSNKGCHFFIHGHPTWSYLWRHLIPLSVKNGYRAIALDLPGFGRSDKIIDKDFFSFNNYRNTIINFIKKLELNEITLFMHEWGGTLGLTLPMEDPKLFKGSVCFSSYLGNGFIPINEAYSDWIIKSKSEKEFNVRALMARTNRILSLSECNAYDAPFPNNNYKLSLNMLPSIYPISQDYDGFEICRKTEEWWKNNNLNFSLILGGGRDPLIPIDKLKMLSKLISTDGLTHIIGNAGHFLPEWGMEFGKELYEQIKTKEDG